MTFTQGGQPRGESAPATVDDAGGGGGAGHGTLWSRFGPGRTGDGRTPRRRADGGGAESRSSAMLVSGLLSLALGMAAMTLPVPYVIESPGPTFNTLGTDNGKPVIAVSGHQTFPAQGSLDLTTVYVDGGPNGPVSVFEALSAWLNGSKAVYPEELIFPTGVTREQSQQESAVAMTTSQENAVAAALKELGIAFEQKLQVAGIPDDSASKGKIQEGDVLVSVGGKPVTALSVIQAELADGKGKPVAVVVDRNGTQLPVTVTPTKSQTGRYLLGVALQYKFKFPFDVKISLDKVGGPSAGMMFALGIVDTVTPGDLTGGKHIAGTGTINPDGAVGAIGGIGQKMVGARSGGATLFLAPAANCDDVVGHIPAGLQVVKVENLTEARHAVELAAGGSDTSGLPACTSN
ncbi:PDZ domain-containing protein [Arthrobacter sp. B3I4]|uniref:YlbL family protein n=1 Tax=Arthrobacter sp. B3I4 TaxID=3042267 RepID=UPI002781660A|nr:S16 family serine protease [Arthrobacter sp. B3I4]MDQ0755706.1 PDZ domain-containing protein [Arthrobacter sp. B3I4]